MGRAVNTARRTASAAPVALLLALLAGAGGCDRAPERPATREVRLAEPLRYVYFDFERGFQPVDSLDKVPMWQRAATIVYRAGDAYDPDKGVYVADLLGAGPGDTVEARLMSRRAHFGRAKVAKAGWADGRAVVLEARDIANLDPNSERQKASRKALRAVEKMLPEDTPSKRTPPR